MASTQEERDIYEDLSYVSSLIDVYREGKESPKTLEKIAKEALRVLSHRYVAHWACIRTCKPPGRGDPLSLYAARLCDAFVESCKSGKKKIDKKW